MEDRVIREEVEWVMVKKISANSAEGGFIGVKMLSALNQDFAMERALSKSVLSAYM